MTILLNANHSFFVCTEFRSGTYNNFDPWTEGSKRFVLKLNVFHEVKVCCHFALQHQPLHVTLNF